MKAEIDIEVTRFLEKVLQIDEQAMEIESRATLNRKTINFYGDLAPIY